MWRGRTYTHRSPCIYTRMQTYPYMNISYILTKASNLEIYEVTSCTLLWSRCLEGRVFIKCWNNPREIQTPVSSRGFESELVRFHHKKTHTWSYIELSLCNKWRNWWSSNIHAYVKINFFFLQFLNDGSEGTSRNSGIFQCRRQQDHNSQVVAF